MITDADIEKLKAVFATKEDFDRLPSKDDVKAMEAGIRRDMATKDDMKAMEASIRRDMATKDDMKAMEASIRRDMATKDDLKSMEARMDKKFATKEDLLEIKREMHLMEKRMDKKFATKVDFHTLEQSLRSEIRLESSALHAEIHEVKNEVIATITDEILKLYGHVGTQDERIYKTNTVQKGQSITIRDHERRIQELEKAPQTA